mmetsp:Transcript_10910/g.16275  ORF Transcript_10910/g.16275 Transcript_10910/m.16275 type:complete len:755 (+) Transcript_10910:3-2267(+)
MVEGTQGKNSKRLVVYNTHLKACVKKGDARAAEKVFAEIVDDGLKPNPKTFGKLIEVYARAGDPQGALRWEQKMTEYGHENNLVTNNEIISAYANANDLKNAEKRLGKMLQNEQADIVSFSSVIHACARVYNGKKALTWLRSLQDYGLKPDSTVYTSVIQALKFPKDHRPNSGGLKEAEKIYREMIAEGIQPSEITMQLLITAATFIGNLEKAEQFFHASPTHSDTRIFNALLDGCAKCGDGKKAEKFLRMIKSKGLNPDSSSYSYSIVAHLKDGSAERAYELYQEMKELKKCPNSTKPYNKFIVAASSYREKRKWLQRMLSDGVVPNEFTFQSIAKFCGYYEAEELFEMFSNAEIFLSEKCHMFMLSKAAKVKEYKKARDWHSRLENSGASQLEKSYHLLLMSSDFEEAKSVVEEMRYHGIELSDSVLTILHEYCSLDCKDALFWMYHFMKELKFRPVARNYNDLFLMASRNGDTYTIAEFFKRWTDNLNRNSPKEYQPTEETFQVMIQACINARDYEKAEQWFSILMEDFSYSISPGVATFNLMIAAMMYSQQTEKVQTICDLMVDSGIRPNTETFTTLITLGHSLNKKSWIEFYIYECVKEGLFDLDGKSERDMYEALLPLTSKFKSINLANIILQNCIDRKIALSGLCLQQFVSGMPKDLKVLELSESILKILEICESKDIVIVPLMNQYLMNGASEKQMNTLSKWLEKQNIQKPGGRLLKAYRDSESFEKRVNKEVSNVFLVKKFAQGE